jgi:hypothetical protein
MGNGNRKDAIDSKYLRPNGLYNLEWDLKVVKKMILERKIAPFYPGKDNAHELESEECPICFLVSLRLPSEIILRSGSILKY